MPELSAAAGLANDLAGLLSRGANAEDFTRHLFRLNIEQVRAGDPELAAMLWACAIPRRFDPTIIGVLRNDRDDHDTNARLLEKLTQFSFVLPRTDQGYVYHDNTRDTVLDCWRNDEERRDQFDTYNQRLASFYESQHEQAKKTQRDLALIADVVQKANPSRYVQLAGILAKLELGPVLDALYHAMLRSPGAGYDFFTRYYFAYENVGRLSECESLVSAATEHFNQLWPHAEGIAGHLNWMRYFEARLARGLRRNAKAEAMFRDLLDIAQDDAKLKLWVLGELGAALHEQYKLREARQMFEAASALAKERSIDPYNHAVWAASSGGLSWTLSELDKAAESYREAIALAGENRNFDSQTQSWLSLSGVLAERGDWRDAADAAFTALHNARTRLQQDQPMHKSVAGRFMALLARREPALLDTCFAEYSALEITTRNPFTQIEAGNQYAEALEASGQYQRAVAVTRDLLARVKEYPSTALYIEVLFRQARQREVLGDTEAAIQAYDEIIQRAGGASRNGAATSATAEDNAGDGERPVTEWLHGAALSNRGSERMLRGDWPGAEADLRAATAKWKALGHEQLTAFLRVSLAEAARRQGRHGKAQQLLDQAKAPLENFEFEYRADYHKACGDVFRDQGRWEEASAEYRRALEVARAFEQTAQCARILDKLTVVAGEHAQWAEAERFTLQAAECWRKLDQMDGYRPSEDMRSADVYNARALTRWLDESADRRAKLAEARDLFGSAIGQFAANPWYHLNLAYICAELGEWADAVDSLTGAIERFPEWLRSPVLYRHLAEYCTRHGEAEFKSGHLEAAERLCETYQARLRQHLPPEALSGLMLTRGDSLIKLGRTGDAEREYRRGLRRLGAGDTARVKATFLARLGGLAAAREEFGAAQRYLRASLLLRTETGGGAWSAEWIDECSTLIGSLPDYYRVDEALGILGKTLPPAERQRVASARLRVSLKRYRDLLRGEAAASTGPSPMIPMVTPIAIELDARLLPDEDTAARDRIVEVEAPALRERIAERFGVRLPGIRLRAGEDLHDGSYLLLLHEVPIVSGSIDATAKFCPDVARCRELGMEGRSAFNPMLQRDGMWLASSTWERVIKAGVLLLDPYQFLMSHLEFLVVRHLASFLGLQETRNLLDRWEEGNEDRRALRAKAVPDDASLARLAQVLRLLIGEEVSISEIERILAAFGDTGRSRREIADVVETIRMALRPALPGNEDRRRLIALSTGFEAIVAQWVCKADGKRFLAMPPKITQDLLTAVRDSINDRPSVELALVVRRHRLRPYVRRLVEIEFPALAVLASRELADQTARPTEQVRLDA